MDLLSLLSQLCSGIAPIVVELLFLQQQLAVLLVAQLKRSLKGNCGIIILCPAQVDFSVPDCEPLKDVIHAHLKGRIDIR